MKLNNFKEGKWENFTISMHFERETWGTLSEYCIVVSEVGPYIVSEESHQLFFSSFNTKTHIRISSRHKRIFSTAFDSAFAVCFEILCLSC